LFYVIIPTLFLYFLLFCYPYILLDFECCFTTYVLHSYLECSLFNIQST